jgi:hypothetical protein
VGFQYFSTLGLTALSDSMKHLLKAREEVKKSLSIVLSSAVDHSLDSIASYFLCNFDPYYLA